LSGFLQRPVAVAPWSDKPRHAMPPRKVGDRVELSSGATGRIVTDNHGYGYTSYGVRLDDVPAPRQLVEVDASDIARAIPAGAER